MWFLKETPHDVFSQSYCEQLASKVMNEHELPMECKTYPIVVDSLRRRMSKNCSRSDQAIAFAGMPAGSAYAAMSNIEKGHLHQAQIQRRQTHCKEKGKPW